MNFVAFMQNNKPPFRRFNFVYGIEKISYYIALKFLQDVTFIYRKIFSGWQFSG